MQGVSRRELIAGAVGLAAAALGMFALAGCSNEPASKKPTAEAGFETIKLGSFVQASGEGAAPEPLEWYVLEEREGGSKLLLCSRCIHRMPFNETWEKVEWQDSGLRAWLNGEFLEGAFTEEERGRIAQGDTGDLVFALSVEEAEKFQGDKVDGVGFANLIGRPTAKVAVDGGHDAADTDGVLWWLRSSGNDTLHAADVAADGTVKANGVRVDDAGVAVRPALVLQA